MASLLVRIYEGLIGAPKSGLVYSIMPIYIGNTEAVSVIIDDTQKLLSPIKQMTSDQLIKKFKEIEKHDPKEAVRWLFLNTKPMSIESIPMSDLKPFKLRAPIRSIQIPTKSDRFPGPAFNYGDIGHFSSQDKYAARTFV